MTDETKTALAVIPAGDMLMDAQAFEQGQRVAKLFASSLLVPAHLRDKPADCFIALYMAKRLNEDPLTVMQSIYIVSGKAGWSASYMIGRANRSGIFKDQIAWETTGAGDAMSVTAKATLQNGTPVTATASMAMAAAEGWTKNAKYRSMPEHMLRYRSATFLIRLYAPEVMLGLPTQDENEDVAASRAVDVTPPRPKREDFVEQSAQSMGETIRVPVDQVGPIKDAIQADEDLRAKDMAATPLKDSAAPPPSYAIVDGFGEIHEFATIRATGLKLLALLDEATTTGALDGIWESNALFLGQIPEAQAEKMTGRYKETRETLAKGGMLADVPASAAGEYDEIEIPASLRRT